MQPDAMPRADARDRIPRLTGRPGCVFSNPTQRQAGQSSDWPHQIRLSKSEVMRQNRPKHKIKKKFP
jgi:hypothetical protein